MGRYVHLKENLYFDSKEKAIVRNMGNRYVFVRHDRRTRPASGARVERRASERNKKSMITVERGLYFDKNTNQLYKKTGDKLVLYSKDRRKSSKPVAKDRRKR